MIDETCNQAPRKVSPREMVTRWRDANYWRPDAGRLRLTQ